MFKYIPFQYIIIDEVIKGVTKMQIIKDSERLRRELEIVSEKTRFKILLTLLSSDNPLSYTQLTTLLPLTKCNLLSHHLKQLKEHNLIENFTREAYNPGELHSL